MKTDRENASLPEGAMNTLYQKHPYKHYFGVRLCVFRLEVKDLHKKRKKWGNWDCVGI
jgi:hypothetical protein